MINSHKDLIVWQKSVGLVKQIYVSTSNFPADEKFGLVSQIRRCAVSIPSNIAEGRSRGSSKEFMHFLTIAMGSAAELETQLIISLDLDFLNKTEFFKLSASLEEIFKMLNKTLSTIKSKSPPSP